MLSLRVRPALARVVDPVADALLRAKVSPDAVTVAGTIGVLFGALAFLPRGMLFHGGLIVTLSVLTDMLDGAMARRLGRSSRFGAWLDSTCDRLADAALFGGLVLFYAGQGDDLLLAGLALFCLVAGSMVSYAKARAEGLGLRCDVGLAERSERLILVLVAIGLHSLGLSWALPAGLWVLAVASAVTVVQRGWEVRRQAAAAQ
jgi:CDP-diacylglycerol--glycerol-3-phosphate 3-phosphatidyltransferase